MSEFNRAHKGDHSLNLRVGDWVEVRSAREILATLDDTQSVDGLPFMPEMLQYCGRRFRVYKSAHRTADTIELFTSRRMANAVFLEGLRCDGGAHGGCQAGCLLFWKHSWLKRVSDGKLVDRAGDRKPSSDTREDSAEISKLLDRCNHTAPGGAQNRYRCQATEMLKATTEVRRRDRCNPLFYVKDLTSGNIRLLEFVRYGALAVVSRFLARWFGYRYPCVRGLAGNKTPSCDLNLQPGELVRVRSKDDIMRTLNEKCRNRGLWFDIEMLPYCNGRTYRVLRRVEKIVNEKTGEIMRFQNPCIVLEGVTCNYHYSDRRMFAQRHEHIFWREIWLERVEQGSSAWTAPGTAV